MNFFYKAPIMHELFRSLIEMFYDFVERIDKEEPLIMLHNGGLFSFQN